MERILLRMLTVSCIAAAPFVFKRKNLLMQLTVFFAKGILSSSVDSYCINNKKIAYPVRPFPKIFNTNVLFDLLFYPLLSVIWVRWTYNAKPSVTILRSLFISVPMSIAQWFMEKKTDLFKWKSWTILHTFAYINFTLFTIKGMVAVLRRLTENYKPGNIHMTSRKKTAIHSLTNHRIAYIHPDKRS